jgi:hypothetical protein
MSGWRQAVFIRQRRIDVIQRALAKILDEESWSLATPRRLRVGSADTSSRGWTMIVPELANFFLDPGGIGPGGTGPGGTGAPRLCRLARELHCPAYEVDVRDANRTTLFEVDALGQRRISGAPMSLPAELPELVANGDAEPTGAGVASDIVGFGLLPVAEDIPDRIRILDRRQPMALADYLGAIAGFPGWTRLALIDSGPQRSKDRNHPAGRVPLAGNHPTTRRVPLVGTRHGDDQIEAGELIYEPPRIARAPEATHGLAHATAGLRIPPAEIHAAIARAKPRTGLPSHDRRGRRPRSAARPRR